MVYLCGFTPYWPDPFFLVRAQSGASRLDDRHSRGASRDRARSGRSTRSRPLDELLVGVDLAAAAERDPARRCSRRRRCCSRRMGLYGVLSQLVARDAAARSACAWRSARGRRRFCRRCSSQAATVTGVGIAAGLASALALARFMATLVFGISSRDPLTFAPCRSSSPGRRGRRRRARPPRRPVDPMHALRED